MNPPPGELVASLNARGQSHLLADWEKIPTGARAAYADELRRLDWDLLGRLYGDREATYAVPSRDRIAPLPHVLPDEPDAEAKAIGEQALARGEIAVLVVAGGQGTRLGFDHPKGLFPIGPVTQKTLFQMHAEKVLARSRKHRRAIPLLVMTSDVTHDETVAYFEQTRFLGLDATRVAFFKQGTMPALDLATGRVLLERPGKLFISPDGHGGTLTALASTGLLDRLAAQGIRHLFYFQVDNPLVKIADPQFIGQHIRAKAEVSSKVIEKAGPHDKLGNFVLIDGKLSMIEYSDLPDELARETERDGRLRIRAGNPAIHVFDVGFLKRITAGGAAGLPFHVARKRAAYWDPSLGEVISPSKENALKFERFIFDVLPLAGRHAEALTSRAEEFAPLKNADGPDSPATVRKAISDLAASWLRREGADAREPVEVSALTALDPEDLAGRVRPGAVVTGAI